MKLVTAVLQANSWPDVFDALQVIDVDGLTITELTATPDATDDLPAARELRVEVIAADEQAEEVAATILEAGPSRDHEGLQLWIRAVEGYTPVRTDEPAF